MMWKHLQPELILPEIGIKELLDEVMERVSRLEDTYLQDEINRYHYAVKNNKDREIISKLHTKCCDLQDTITWLIGLVGTIQLRIGVLDKLEQVEKEFKGLYGKGVKKYSQGILIDGDKVRVSMRNLELTKEFLPSLVRKEMERAANGR
jgi:hypothetical protein